MGLNKLPNRTYPGLGLSMLDRAVKEHFCDERCSEEDLADIRRYFRERGGLRCIYCGDRSPAQWRWDHAHPISQGGCTVKGNLVPACSTCDDSKQDKTIDEWFDSKSKKRPPPQRRDGIKRAVANYQAYFKYRPVLFPGRLHQRQKRTYAEFLRRLESLRAFLTAEGIVTGRER